MRKEVKALRDLMKEEFELAKKEVRKNWHIPVGQLGSNGIKAEVLEFVYRMIHRKLNEILVKETV